MKIINIFILITAGVFILSAQSTDNIPVDVLEIEQIEIMGTAREPLVINIAATARIDFSNFLIARSFSDEIINQVFLTRGELGRLGRGGVSRPISKSSALLGATVSLIGGYLMVNGENSGVVFLSTGSGLLLLSGIFYLSGK